MRTRPLLVLLAAALIAAACSTDDGDDRAGPTTAPPTEEQRADGEDGDEGGGPVPAGLELSIVNYNVLHGLPLDNCPEETDGCRADVRLDMIWELLEEDGCPEVVALQEIGPHQRELIPATLPERCDGAYEIVSEDTALPVTQWILSTLPVLDASSELISGISRSVQWVRLETPEAPVDLYTTHFVAGIDNLACTEELCTDICELGAPAGDCNPLELLAFVDRTADPDTPTIVTGDLNARLTDDRVRTITDSGFEDVWVLAGNPDCDPETTRGCTSTQAGDGPFDGLDQPESTRTTRIDFILVRVPEDCELWVSDVDLFAGEPFDPPVEGLHWPSDHAGVMATLGCA